MTLLCVVLVAGRPAGVAAAPSTSSASWLIPPVDAPMTAPFTAPVTDFGPGHRGIDYDAPSGTAVRAAGKGTVAFAGSAAGTLAVTIEHGGGLESTYSMLSEVGVTRGEVVDPGTWIGRTGAAHPTDTGGLHFGVKLNERYVDPLSYLGPLDLGDAFHLAPVVEDPDAQEADRQGCSTAAAAGARLPAPNDNIAVMIAGINSASSGPSKAIIHGGARYVLGYPERRTYRFSYRGVGANRLHRPYGERDTYGDLRKAARGLRTLLERIALEHPGRDVDLVAHSQGGIVARSLLEENAGVWDPELPRIEHLVTFATPHSGAPLAGAVRDIADKTFTGGAVLDLAAGLAPVPDAHATSVAQLAPGSPLLERLAKEDVLYGTRALALTLPNDYIVPADRALLPEETSRVLPPEGGGYGHDAIVRSALARGVAHSFLSGASEPCTGAWDSLGPTIGRVVGFVEARTGMAYSALESTVAGGAARAAAARLPGVARVTGRAVGATGRRLHTAGRAAASVIRSVGRAALSLKRKEPPPPGGMGG